MPRWTQLLCSIVGVSKKQTRVSKSIPEAEIVAIDHGLAKHALPALSLWEAILGKKITNALMEDKSAACRIVIAGRNPSMRHMSRTQRIDAAWLNERYSEKAFRFIECPSEFQAGDIMTKHFTDVKVWERNLNLICHFEDEVFAKAFTKSWLRDRTGPRYRGRGGGERGSSGSGTCPGSCVG